MIAVMNLLLGEIFPLESLHHSLCHSASRPVPIPVPIPDHDLSDLHDYFDRFKVK